MAHGSDHNTAADEVVWNSSLVDTSVDEEEFKRMVLCKPMNKFHRNGISHHLNEDPFDFEDQFDDEFWVEVDRVLRGNVMQRWKRKLDAYEAFLCVRTERLIKQLAEKIYNMDPLVILINLVEGCLSKDRSPMMLENSIDLLTFYLFYDKMECECSGREPHYSELIQRSHDNWTTVLYLLLQIDQGFAPVMAAVRSWYPGLEYVRNRADQCKTTVELIKELDDTDMVTDEAYNAILGTEETHEGMTETTAYEGKISIERILQKIQPSRIRQLDTSLADPCSVEHDGIKTSVRKYVEKGKSKGNLPRRSLTEKKCAFVLYNDKTQNKLVQNIVSTLERQQLQKVTDVEVFLKNKNKEHLKMALEKTDWMIIVLLSEDLKSFFADDQASDNWILPPELRTDIEAAFRPCRPDQKRFVLKQLESDTHPDCIGRVDCTYVIGTSLILDIAKAMCNRLGH